MTEISAAGRLLATAIRLNSELALLRSRMQAPKTSLPSAIPSGLLVSEPRTRTFEALRQMDIANQDTDVNSSPLDNTLKTLPAILAYEDGAAVDAEQSAIAQRQGSTNVLPSPVPMREFLMAALAAASGAIPMTSHQREIPAPDGTIERHVKKGLRVAGPATRRSLAFAGTLFTLLVLAILLIASLW
ncbi:MAG: hypothetical protein ABL907_01100 [Hyphomicrobium sp.]